MPLAKLFEGARLMVAGVGVNGCPVTVGVDFSPGGGLIELDLDGYNPVFQKHEADISCKAHIVKQ